MALGAPGNPRPASRKRKRSLRSLISPSYKPLSFIDFVRERQAVFERRSRGLPRQQWTSDEVLRLGRFCNIDRRDDRVTRELLHSLEALGAATNGLRRRVMLVAALRFTSSRRGEAEKLAQLLPPEEESTKGSRQRRRIALVSALLKGMVRCGVGTYQMTLSCKELSRKIETAVDAIIARVSAGGPFPHVAAAADFVAQRMTVKRVTGKCKPQFAANETAKDFLYISGLLSPNAAEHCPLGRGARKGLTVVTKQDSRLHGLSLEEAVKALRSQLCTCRSSSGASLAWIKPIDVEQALCEYYKYTRYFKTGVRKPFEPSHMTIASLRQPQRVVRTMRLGRSIIRLPCTKPVHSSHSICQKRGVTWCTSCGAWAGPRNHYKKKLVAACEGQPNKSGSIALRLLPERYPRYNKDWPDSRLVQLKTS